ncbi:MAG TPA: hypothetical protein VIF82_02230 [Burkholderiaceae bacterium]|jgi:hypothetical protein
MAYLDSYFIDRAAAEKAVQLCMPMIHSAMESREAGASGFFYIVIMKPGCTPDSNNFSDAILYEYAMGDREKWDADYGEFARAKAKLAWRTGMDADIVQQRKPHLLVRGDTVLGGSIVLDGIVVGVSGADPWYDEAFAGTIAMCLRALAKKGIAAEREKNLFLKEK